MSEIKNVVIYQPKSRGGNFEYALIPRQGSLFLSGALKKWNDRSDAQFYYDTEVWLEERSGKLDPARDLDGVDILMVTALINEAPEAYRIAREAREHHPDLVLMGGGPQMSPLPQEAMYWGKFDVIVEREAEDIIGPLCDVCMAHPRPEREQYLERVPGIFFEKNGYPEYVARLGAQVIPASAFVEFPDFQAIRGLSSGTPMMAGVLESVRGCVEKCDFCQVIKQFLSYRFASLEVQLKRLAQLRELVASGLIHSSKGVASVFISDDLHIPPLNVPAARNRRLAMLKAWKGHTESLTFTCQVRAEIGQDEEIADAMLEVGIQRLYIGVESNDVRNLELVHKRQDPEQVYKDLERLRKKGFKLVGMTIIGLPFDTEETIMELASWITELTDQQTMNWITPLPATVNWKKMLPLDAKGNVLPTDEDGNVPPELGLRPYHLYTGEQLVTYDPRWTMAESYALGRKYYAKLKSVDHFYRSIFRRSIQLNTGKWAEKVAFHFHGLVASDLVERIRQTLQTPSTDRLGELWTQVVQATGTLRDTRVAEALAMLKSYQELFGYTRPQKAETV